MKIKDWYIKEFPTDECGEYINTDVTFQDIIDTLDDYGDVYKLLFTDRKYSDSIVRERVFAKLSELSQIKYSDIYDRWLECEDEE